MAKFGKMTKFDWGVEVIISALVGGGITWLFLSGLGMPDPLLFFCCGIGASASFWADNFRNK